MGEISVHDLKKMKDENQDFCLVDVRESYEFDMSNLDGELIPMGSVLNSLDKIPKDKPVVMYCRSGIRSASVIRELEANHGYTNLYNLQGGIMAWVAEIDQSMNV
jgi:sulfur-carrier protein adenylyltransferase/sulfurtransferase